jgi:precorrin-2/cobalt-factor-2 C20-methyltransferase
MMLGTFYGIGVGPGDPELLTLKAVKVLGQVDHIFAASSSNNDYSVACDIVRQHLKPDTPVDFLSFPMTFKRDRLENAWHANCRKVVEVLGRGKDTAFLTLGDPLTYSTYIYLARKVRSRLPDVVIQTIPGITAFHAAAARANVPLAEGEESITIISGAKGGERLQEVIGASDNVVLMKVYKQFPQILQQIRGLELQDRCCLISRCGLEGEVVERDFERLAEHQPHYLSRMIIKKRGMDW